MVTLDPGLDAEVSDLDTAFDTDLSADAKMFWLNVGYTFLNSRLNWAEFSTSTKKQMEVLAAADAASTQDPRVYREAVGDAEFRYQRADDETDYWRMLLALDHTGSLVGAKSGKTVGFEALGPGRD